MADNTGAIGPTGAGGPSGAPSGGGTGTTTSVPPGQPQPKAPAGTGTAKTVGYTGPVTAQGTWDRSKHASAIQNAYEALRATAVEHLPSLGRQINLLANRKIGDAP
jgi:hypothetical protein